MIEQERKAALNRQRELEMLHARQEADALFIRNEEEKRRRKFGELKELQNFHQEQIVSASYRHSTLIQFGGKYFLQLKSRRALIFQWSHTFVFLVVLEFSIAALIDISSIIRIIIFTLYAMLKLHIITFNGSVP